MKVGDIRPASSKRWPGCSEPVRKNFTGVQRAFGAKLKENPQTSARRWA